MQIFFKLCGNKLFILKYVGCLNKGLQGSLYGRLFSWRLYKFLLYPFVFSSVSALTTFQKNTSLSRGDIFDFQNWLAPISAMGAEQK